MGISITLSSYLGRQFLASFLAVFAGILLVILLADTIELLRRVAGKPDVTFIMVAEMALLKLPFMGQQTFPFAALFAAMVVFWRLSRHHELVVVRAAGVSVWQFLLPAVVVAILLGVVQVTVFNPMASAFLARFERIEALRINRQVTTLAVSGSGLWLREAEGDRQAVIHAERVVQDGDGVELLDVTVFRFEGEDRFIGRIGAASARLGDGEWRLVEASVLDLDRDAVYHAELSVPTTLTVSRIRDSFASPRTISFWNLPGFIATLEAAGFSATGHRLQLHTLLAAPLLMCAMVLVAATFTLRLHGRRGGAMLIVAGALVTGFAFHIFSDLVFALGLADRVPVALSAWTPSSVITLLGVSSLLFLEDG